MGLCVGIHDTPEHARVPVPFGSTGEITAPKLIRWREDAASNRTRVLVAASRSRHVRPVPWRGQEPVLDAVDDGPSAAADTTGDIRGKMIDILV